MKKGFLFVLSLFVFGYTFAGGSTTVSRDVKVSSEWVPPVPSTSVNYIFDETGTKALLTQNNLLLQINCNVSIILQSLGLGSSSKKIFTLGIQEGDYEYTFDIRNCSLRGNKANANYSYTKSLTEKTALTIADQFMKTSFLKDKVFSQLGKPIIVYKNSHGPYYPVMKEGMGYRENVSVFSGIEIEEGNEEEILPDYTSFSVLYPYLINGQEVWEQYGNRAGIQLEVTADGVMSFNARLLPFKAAKRTSEKLSGDDAIRILKNGGNSPFRGQFKEIKFNKPEKVLVLFNLRRDNKTYLYLSSGIGLKSTVKPDQRAQQDYTMILSDYKIGNNVQ